jgi:hypothetical protein
VKALCPGPRHTWLFLEAEASLKSFQQGSEGLWLTKLTLASVE